MSDSLYLRISANPAFHALQARRARLAWTLVGLVVAAYYSFILMVAFAGDILRQPLHEGTVVTLGLAWGAGVMVLCIALTGVYVWRANREFDHLTQRVLDDALSES